MVNLLGLFGVGYLAAAGVATNAAVVGRGLVRAARSAVRGDLASISGVSGVATKTSYATFLLYGLFHSEALGLEAPNTRALIFNVKGEDLLWLDRPNARLRDEDRRAYERLGLPAGPFQSVGLFAPVRRRSDIPMPDTGSRHDGVTPYC